jgi:hypothetical protein
MEKIESGVLWRGGQEVRKAQAGERDNNGDGKTKDGWIQGKLVYIGILDGWLAHFNLITN